MEEKNRIPLSSLIKEFKLETIYLPREPEEIFVTAPEVDRPGLALSGFLDIFEESRIQLIGIAEYNYLSNMNAEERDERIRAFVAKKPVVIMMTSGNPAPEELIKYCKEYGVPLLSTEELTSATMAALFASLNVHLAPCITRHGVLVEVYGEGILILGDSGVGKSETAIELVKRGHRLIADDAVEIKRVSKKALVGQAPEILRHYVELRGIGIIDVKRLYGISAVKDTEKIDLVINLESWVQGKMYDRLGLDEQTINILGIDLPSLTIPVRPGRNLAIILEIAAMNNRQKKMGYNTAEEFNKRLMAMMGIEE
ncbi:MAG: HPr(Ser) kinase/phosphatase [Clostridia bacterium]|nr:HPr(Ser) kinase/phosphatase [Clostridia bacterium]